MLSSLVRYVKANRRQVRDAALILFIVSFVLSVVGCVGRFLKVEPPPALASDWPALPEPPDEARLSYQAWVEHNEAVARQWVARIEIVEERREQLLALATGAAGFLSEEVRSVPGLGPAMTGAVGLASFFLGRKRR